jgi:hypothetical protein
MRTLSLLFVMFLGSCSLIVAQQIPTVGLSIPFGNTLNGAERRDDKTVVLRERAVTVFGGGNGFQNVSILVNRSSSTAQIAVRYALEYFSTNSTDDSITYRGISNVQLNSLPNQGAITLLLPSAFLNDNGCPVPVTSFPFPYGPVAINGLQGDLKPVIEVPGQASLMPSIATITNPGSFTLNPGVSRTNIRFTARLSDQLWYRPQRTAGRQNVRVAVLKLLPSTTVPLSYQVENGKDSIIVYLADTDNKPPALINWIPDVLISNEIRNQPTTGTIELENECWRADNLPKSVFYDDNYDPQTYTVVVENQPFVTVAVARSNPTPTATPGIPLLIWSVAPRTPAGTEVRVTVTANDGRTDRTYSQSQCTFRIKVASSTHTGLTEKQDDSRAISISPNPARDLITVQGVALRTGIMKLNVVNVLGQTVISKEAQAVAGINYTEKLEIVRLLPGVYMVEVESGGVKEVKKVVKE